VGVQAGQTKSDRILPLTLARIVHFLAGSYCFTAIVGMILPDGSQPLAPSLGYSQVAHFPAAREVSPGAATKSSRR
jgi:hypothetical protein